MVNVRVADFRRGTIVNVPVNDTLITALKEKYEKEAHRYFVTFSDYVEAWVAFNLT